MSGLTVVSSVMVKCGSRFRTILKTMKPKVTNQPVAYTTNELFDIFKEVCMFKNINSDADNECET